MDEITKRTGKGRAMERAAGWIERNRAAALATTAFVAMNGSPAYADDPNQILSTIMSLAVSAVSLFGGALVVWGGVKFGLAIKDQQGGNAIAESLATLAGGAIIIAAGTYFGTLTFNG